MLEDIESRWSRELQEEVEIGSHPDGDYSLYIGGTFVERFTSLPALEHYLYIHMRVLPDLE
jgi:hypothetical protein